MFQQGKFRGITHVLAAIVPLLTPDTVDTLKIERLAPGEFSFRISYLTPCSRRPRVIFARLCPGDAYYDVWEETEQKITMTSRVAVTL